MDDQTESDQKVLSFDVAGRGPINSKGRSPEAGRTVIEELLSERGTPLQLPQ
jgi:hypothetical protein